MLGHVNSFSFIFISDINLSRGEPNVSGRVEEKAASIQKQILY